MAWVAQGQVTIKVVERSTPFLSARVMASLTAWHIPKSSALIIRSRASAGYPSRQFVWPLFNGVTSLIHVSKPRLFHNPAPRRVIGWCGPDPNQESRKPVSSHCNIRGWNLPSSGLRYQCNKYRTRHGLPVPTVCICKRL